jgi:anaerobic ribonucleoside-triphosphate reductase
MSQNKITKIQKRDGTIVDFDQTKITNAIFKAITATGQGDGKRAKKISDRVVQILNRRFKKTEIPSVEQIQDIIEEVLILENLVETAKAYILYREQRRRIREAVKVSEEAIDRMDQYLEKLDWEVQENANMAFSLQGLNHYGVSYIVKKYWLNRIYPKEIREANESGDFHLHNLDTLGPYCAGWDLYDLLLKGFQGVPGKVETKPAKHFRAILGQLVNFLYTLQGEVAGAVAVSNFDTLLAPFIRYDNLNYQQVKQALQEFLFNMAVPTRVGFQCPFSNITLDLKPSPVFAKQPVIIGGKPQKETYQEFEEEMKIFDKALYETMLEGDKSGRPFHFPIPTINITKDFPWLDPAFDGIFEASAKYGTNYFANYINSEMKPEDVRSMCCRLRLEMTELYNRGGGGLFGSGSKTGCYDEKTEVLTEDGWKLFKDLTERDKVFTLADNNKIELHKPNRFFEYDYRGEMVHFKGRAFDLLVTPNHRMVVDHKHKNKRIFVEAKDFKPYQHFIPKGGIWQGEEKEYFILPAVEALKGTGPVSRFSENDLEIIRRLRKEGTAYYKIAEDFNCSTATVLNVCNNLKYGEHKLWSYQAEPVKIKMDDWLKFFGFWLAEGCTDNNEIASGHGYRVTITQTNKENREEIKKVLDALPFNYYEEKNNIIICSKQLWAYLRQFGNKYQKFIPKEIKKLSKRQLKILFDWLVKGDGHIRKTTGQINYWTASKRLADDLQEIILKLGWIGVLTPQKKKISQIKGRDVVARTIYLIEVHQKTKHFVFNKKRVIKRIDYEGKIYCCEVPNHTVFVRRNGKVSWCGNSIGVVTINLPRIGYLSKTKKEFFERLGKMMDLSKESLEIKRKTIENFIEKSLYPYSKFYLSDIKKARGGYYANHFATIGLVGMNEALLNFIGENIASRRGRRFALEVLDFMREKLVKYQKETGNIYNLEATPAESTAYRLALKDREKYPDIICAGTKKEPYYTNSSQLPVNYTDDLFEALKLQDELQCKYSGGTVLHLFLGEKISDTQIVKSLIKKIFENFHLPYITLTPTFSICPVHGYLAGEHFYCPKCTIKQPCEVYSRIVGYLRPVQQWNEGKQEEFRQRKEFKVPKIVGVK